MKIDPELEHRDVFQAKTDAEVMLNRCHAMTPYKEDLINLTSAVLNYWRKIRPYIMQNDEDKKTYYDGKLDKLDKIEVAIAEFTSPNKIDRDKENRTTLRAFLSYEEGVNALRILNEIYVVILGYGPIRRLPKTHDI